MACLTSYAGLQSLSSASPVRTFLWWRVRRRSLFDDTSRHVNLDSCDSRSLSVEGLSISRINCCGRARAARHEESPESATRANAPATLGSVGLENPSRCSYSKKRTNGPASQCRAMFSGTKRLLLLQDKRTDEQYGRLVSSAAG